MKKVGRPEKNKNKIVTLKKTVSCKQSSVKWDNVWKDVSCFTVITTVIYTLMALLTITEMLWFIPIMSVFALLTSMFIHRKEEWIEVQEEV